MDFPGLDSLPDDAVAITHTSASVELSITTASSTHVLKLSPLGASIENATVRRRPGKVVVTLVKSEPSAWFDLLKGAAPSGGFGE